MTPPADERGRSRYALGSLDLLLPLALVLTVAKLAGAIARRFRLPAVLGDLITGVAMGPIFLGVLQPTEVGRGALAARQHDLVGYREAHIGRPSSPLVRRL